MANLDETSKALEASSGFFRRLRGSAQGKRVFILGTGPSAVQFDLTRLKEEITLSVNGFGRHPEIDRIAPKYHLIADPSAWDPVNSPVAFRDTLASLAFLDRNPARLILPMNFAGMTLTHPDYRRWNPYYYVYSQTPKLPIDFSEPIPLWGQNILDIALMFCLHLAAREVILIGFDNGGVINRLEDHRNFYPAGEKTRESLKTYDQDLLQRCMEVHLQILHQLRRLALDARMGIFTTSPDGSFRMFPFLPFEALPGLAHPDGCAEPKPVRAPAEPTLEAEGVIGRVFAQAAEAPEAIAIRLLGSEGWRTYTRGAFASRVERYGRRFRSIGQPGSLVLFLKRTDEDLLAAYLGAMAAGRVPAQMSPPTAKVKPEEHGRWLGHVLDLMKAECIFTDRDFDPAGLGGRGLHWLTPDLTAAASGDAQYPGREPLTDPALAQLSSGTTGLQKGVFLTHRGLLAHMDNYAKVLKLGPKDVIISWLPLYHDMGLIAAFLMPLMTGVPLVLMDPFRWISHPGSMVESADQFGATIAFLPNFAYHVLAGKCAGPGFRTMRLFVNCSEPARPETHRQFLEAFPAVAPEALSVCYAMAENTFAVSQTEPGERPRILQVAGKRLLSCGRVVPGTEVTILDPDPDGIGEVAIRGQCLFHSFLDRVDRLKEGYYPTGDLGLLDQGEVFITGRKKDLIIVNGKNIYPQDVEFAASGCEGVYPGRTVCFGIENEKTGSEDLVVLAEAKAPDADGQLVLRVSRAVAMETGIIPWRVAIVAHMSLVKTSSGKISRSRNKELFLQGRFGVAAC
jgi:acyl-CoA synthetase (AMP-forming)/AMP-acid ligase II